MTTPTPHTATMRATMDELRSVFVKTRNAYRLAQKAFPVDSEPFRTINREANLLDSLIGGLSDRIEAPALDKQGVDETARYEIHGVTSLCRWPKCGCAGVQHIECKAPPPSDGGEGAGGGGGQRAGEASVNGAFAAASASETGAPQRATTSPPVSPSAAERLEQEYERMDAAIEAFHKAWPSFSAWFLRDDEMKIINTPPEPFEAFLEVWNRRPAPPPQPERLEPYNSGYTHEALHVAHILTAMMDDYIQQTRTCDEYPDVKAAADKIGDALGGLYQLIGQKLHAEEAAEGRAEAAEQLGVHLSHCNFGENAGVCKYGEETCPAVSEAWSWLGKGLDRSTSAEAQLQAANKVVGTLWPLELVMRDAVKAALEDGEPSPITVPAGRWRNIIDALDALPAAQGKGAG